MTRLRVVACVLGLLLLVAAPASGAVARHNIVVQGITDAFPGFNTFLNCCDFGNGPLVEPAVLRGAFRQDAKGRWVLDLVTAAHATRKGVSYTISPNAFWDWGGRKVAVTYKDFAYTLQQIDDPANDASEQRGAYGNLDPARFTHRGARQVTFFWRTTNCSSDFPCGPVADWQQLFSLAPALYPSFALKGEDFNKIWLNCICGSDGKPVADGPFYLASYSKGAEIVLKRNPFWGGKKSSLGELDYRIFADGTLMVEALRQGYVDLVNGATGQAGLSVIENAPGITITTSPTHAYEHLEFREGRSPGASTVTKGASNGLLRAPWMRDAIALGLDRRAMIRAGFGDFADKIKTDNGLNFFPSQASYRPVFAEWNYDPRRALAILKSHCDRGSGPSAPSASNEKIWRCDGQSATFRWTWQASRIARTAAAQVAKAELTAIGIGLVERPLPGTVIFTPSGLPSGDFDIAEFAWTTTGDPGDNSAVFHCRGEQNYTGFCSRQVDKLIDAGDSELNPAKRTVDFQKVDKLLAASVTAFPLYESPSFVIYNSKLVGVDGPPEDLHWKG